jgi:5'-phosphate synthase pdxT subunit
LKQIGILALQGDFEKHKFIINKLGHHPHEVRDAADLNKCDGLILPGGESTTFLKLIYDFNLKDNLIQYTKNHPILATCAGLIIISKQLKILSYPTLELIDIKIERNAYGRQKQSFIDQIKINLNGKTDKYSGVFIRAPKIVEYGPQVSVLGTHNKDVVLASSKNILVCTFHPELTEDFRIHDYFLSKYF